MKRSALIASVMGALMAAQGYLLAKWPGDYREWTMLVIAVLIGFVGGLSGKQANSAIDKKNRNEPPDQTP